MGVFDKFLDIMKLNDDYDDDFYDEDEMYDDDYEEEKFQKVIRSSYRSLYDGSLCSGYFTSHRQGFCPAIKNCQKYQQWYVS